MELYPVDSRLSWSGNFTNCAGQQWLTITLYLYDIGWGQWNFGRAAALAWILFIIILLIGLINLLITRTLVRDEGTRSVEKPRRSLKKKKEVTR